VIGSYSGDVLFYRQQPRDDGTLQWQLIQSRSLAAPVCRVFQCRLAKRDVLCILTGEGVHFQSLS
jgi:hypothetical protein